MAVLRVPADSFLCNYCRRGWCCNLLRVASDGQNLREGCLPWKNRGKAHVTRYGIYCCGVFEESSFWVLMSLSLCNFTKTKLFGIQLRLSAGGPAPNWSRAFICSVFTTVILWALRDTSTLKRATRISMTAVASTSTTNKTPRSLYLKMTKVWFQIFTRP